MKFFLIEVFPNALYINKAVFPFHHRSGKGDENKLKKQMPPEQ